MLPCDTTTKVLYRFLTGAYFFSIGQVCMSYHYVAKLWSRYTNAHHRNQSAKSIYVQLARWYFVVCLSLFSRNVAFALPLLSVFCMIVSLLPCSFVVTQIYTVLLILAHTTCFIFQAFCKKRDRVACGVPTQGLLTGVRNDQSSCDLADSSMHQSGLVCRPCKQSSIADWNAANEHTYVSNVRFTYCYLGVGASES